MVYSVSKWAALDLMDISDATDQQTLDDNEDSKDTDEVYVCVYIEIWKRIKGTSTCMSWAIT